MSWTWSLALIGGAMIGGGSAVLLLTQGRLAGISGITGSLLERSGGARTWRLAFIAGLLVTGVVARLGAPHAVGESVRSLPLVVIAGLLVGYGTQLGSGCTSGHGVCGLSRLSARSFVAVATFMTTGALTAWLVGGAS